MPKIFLGPLVLKWCKNCNLPILEKNTCDLCTNPTEKVNISPPGDIRPALEGDLKLIRNSINKAYGNGLGEQLIPSDKIVLLNKIGAAESSDEIILDGQIIGLLIFDPLKLQWYFRPKIEGARRLIAIKKSRFVIVDDGAVEYILKGANVLAPGIKDYDREIKIEEYVSILNEDEKVIGLGISKVEGGDIAKIKRGTIIKTKDTEQPKESAILKGGQNWDDVVNANTTIMNHKINKAKKTIKQTASKYSNPLIVSFSGGKDSLCTLILVNETITDFKILFIDTGIEFKETVDYVKDTINRFGLKNKFIYKTSGGDFWEGLKEFGPPARDFRYCCKTLKLSAVTEAISENFNETIINFTGQRRYESIPRSQEKLVWTNPYVPNQINVAPIKNWTHLHVWLYLKDRKVPMNILYHKGYQRIGCMYCPATKLSELKTMEELHPYEFNRFINFLKNWAKKYGYPEEWVYYGFWRWKQPGPKQEQLANILGINIKPILNESNEEELKFAITRGISPCKDGGYIIEGKFNRGLDLEKIAESLKSLGNPKYSEKMGVIYLKREDASISIFAEGSLKINLTDRNKEVNIVEKMVKLIIRAMRCTKCGICIKACPMSAITINENGIRIDKNKCSECLKCIESCPAINYTYPYFDKKIKNE